MSVLQAAIALKVLHQTVHRLKADVVKESMANPVVRQCQILWLPRWTRMAIGKSLLKNFRQRPPRC